MKKKLVRLFVALLAVVILCTQLPLGFLTNADSVSEVPTEYPVRTVYKLMADLDYTAMNPSPEQTETKFINAVDFTSPDYDYFEFDLFISPSAAFTGTVEIALYDEVGGLATYSFEAGQYYWLDIKIPTDAFTLDGIDMTNVVGYRINNPQSWIQYKFANLCFTGIKRPQEIPQGDVDYLIERLDVVDNNKNSSSSAVFGFDELEYVDFLSKDWVEFDVYVLGTSESSVNVAPTIYFVDENYVPGTTRYTNYASYKLSLLTNEWKHFKIPANNFTRRSCNTDKVVGVMLTGMVNDYRYVVSNVSLKTAVVEDPAIPDNATILKEGELIQYYSVAEGSATEYSSFDNPVDISANDHIVVDIYADSSTDDVQTVKLNLKDNNGKLATALLNIKPGEWVNAKILIDALDAQTGFDYAMVASVSISNLKETTRYFLTNFYLTDASFAIEDKYPDNASQKFDSINVDYFADASANIPTDSYVDLGGTYNLNNFDYVEFDLFVDTQLDSSELPENFEIYLVDTGNKKVLGTKAYAYNSVQHIRILVSAMSNSGSGLGGNLANIKGFCLDNAVKNSRYIIKNFCFTKITAPEAPTKDVLMSLLAYSDVTARYNHFYDDAVTFDGLDPAYDSSLDSYDISVGEYLQFDIYVVLDESSSTYADSLSISFKMCDRPNYYKHVTEAGRAHASFTVNTNEWVRVRIPLSSFGYQPGQTCDFTQVCRYFLEGNAKGTRYVVANMCIGKRATLPAEEDKASMPEKGVRYVTDCDGANSTDNGVWTSSRTYFTTDYKTEGKGSAALEVSNQETDAMNSHRFLFASPADLSKSKNIKFDLFIDDIDLASTCDFKLYLSSDRRCADDNFIYFLDSSVLKLGWNSFDILLSEFIKEDTEAFPDWSSINCFAVEVIINEPFESYGAIDEYFLLCLDNIRIGDTYVLQSEVEGEDEPPADDNSNTVPSTNENPGTITKENHTTFYEDAEVITLSPEENTTYITKRVIKKQKVLLDDIAQSHWITLIVTCCVAVILIAGSVVLVILSSRKNKRGGSN